MFYRNKSFQINSWLYSEVHGHLVKNTFRRSIEILNPTWAENKNSIHSHDSLYRFSSTIQSRYPCLHFVENNEMTESVGNRNTVTVTSTNVSSSSQETDLYTTQHGQGVN